MIQTKGDVKMEKWLFAMFIEKTKSYNRLTKAAV